MPSAIALARKEGAALFAFVLDLAVDQPAAVAQPPGLDGFGIGGDLVELFVIVRARFHHDEARAAIAGLLILVAADETLGSHLVIAESLDG
jgi:hypothetical protein